ncbi:MAG: cysteine--tRNA ligase [Burkholderiaceae bacterium]
MSMLQIYNTLSRSKQAFEPIEPGKVRMYVCGMTVYDYCHLGHARVMVVFDLVQRWLRASGYDVTYVRNITDIDDKIIRRAVEAGSSIRALTDRFIEAMHEDEAALGIQPPDAEPRATEHVPAMLTMIGELEKNGLAYRAGNGDVNFSVRGFAGYGRLSGKSLDDLRAGERVAVDAGKQDPLDFVLWKAGKADEPAEVRWPGPYGEGRPGWHIECSAMSRALLGQTLDIHGGGEDLQFPHHENEIAQSEGSICRPGDHTPFVRYWMHNAFVRVDDEKMSKSLGNFFTVRDILARFDAEVVRFFLLRAHYRSPINYTDANLDDARQGLLRLYTARGDIGAGAPVSPDLDSRWGRRFAAAMNDDFNTPQAVALLFEMAGELNRDRSPALRAEFAALAGLLGLLARPLDEVRRTGLQPAAGGSAGAMPDEQIDRLIAERTAAKQARDYAAADRLRDELAAAGIVLEDSAQGTTWRRA